MTAQQFASAFQCFVSAVTLRPDSAESFMMLASKINNLVDSRACQLVEQAMHAFISIISINMCS